MASAPPPSADASAGVPNLTRVPYPRKPGVGLEDFEAGCIIGTGTFGKVRLVRYKPNGQVYAMKVLKKSEIIRLKQVEHILSEKQVLSLVDHPFLVKLHDTFQDDTFLYMVMDFIVGGEMFSHLRALGRFTSDMAKFYGAQVVLAFEFLHSRSIVYRDLKPENLLLDRQGYISIVDFGFAKKVLDRTWTLCGTPEYLAPEIIQSKGHNKGVDWWALGILIYEMLAGHPPFYDDNPFGTYQQILANKPVFPSHFDPAATDLIRGLLTTDTTKRFGCMRAGADDIKTHRWFAGFDWDGLQKRRLPGPIIPHVEGDDDVKNFDEYEEEALVPGRPVRTPDVFGDFCIL
eukprot:gnl/Hemi2/28532_TR9450_c0_g1_i1.p1 gnl/Hemi2/28532_TR9450_c0_g1~~gnl/Hemi2/28532_TR9450_c0_g1_i1.p1  ORF type:complete len:345 (-),score=59.24 gnl/Hemi2/28532_TR9450_c0_g1_i1:166-1200(-)